MILRKLFTVGGIIVLLCGTGDAAVAAMAIPDADTTIVHVVASADTTASLYAPGSAVSLHDSSAPVQPHFFSRLGRDFLVQASAPFRMDAGQAANAGAGVVITLGLVALDDRFDRAVRPLDAKYPVIRSTSRALTDFGGPYGVLTAVAYTGYSVIWSDEEAQQTSMLLAEALITSGVWTRLGKLLAGRERPSAAYEFSHLPGGRWHGLGGSLRRHSSETLAKYDAFPSGHTATAFALATVFAKRYSETGYVPVLSYSLATIIGITRMIEHTHWASDVFAGACIGYLCADQAVTQFEEESAAQKGIAKQNAASIRFSIGMLHQSPALQLAVGF